MNAMEATLAWLEANADKIIFLLVTLAVAALVTKSLGRLMRKALDRSNIPSASIFINIMRVIVWSFAVSLVLQPVFGINPTTLMTALGVGGIAVSLGLKDTVANVIGGFGLMLGKVIQPGDLVTIQGTTGTVIDITWRQTMIETRSGDRMAIPNSVLNTTSLTKLLPANEGTVVVPFTIRGDADPQTVSKDMLRRVGEATADITLPANPPLVKITGFSPFGTEGQVLLFARHDVLLSTVRDRAARALAGADYLVVDGGAANSAD